MMKRELLDNGNIWSAQELFQQKEKDVAGEDDRVCQEFQ